MNSYDILLNGSRLSYQMCFPL